MSKLRSFALWTLTLAVVLVVAVCVTAPVVRATEETLPVTEDVQPEPPAQPEPTVKQGLVTENGNTYFYNEDGALKTQNGEILFYNEDGSLYTGGYQEVTHLGKIDYYFFQEDGTAFTGGYKVITRGDKRVYYYFQEDGTAYTGGYLHVRVPGAAPGDIVRVRVTDVMDDELKGEMIHE